MGISVNPFCEQFEYSKAVLNLTMPSGEIIRRTESSQPYSIFGDRGATIAGNNDPKYSDDDIATPSYAVIGRTFPLGNYIFEGTLFARYVGTTGEYLPIDNFGFLFEIVNCDIPFVPPYV